MKKPMINSTNKVLIVILLLLTVLFSISLFKNIAYPLLWNDEAETVMYSTRVLEYGYPKVHDGKNVLRQIGLLGTQFVKNEKRDAYSGAVQGQFYLSTIGVLLARNVDDIYIKTALLRIPFAVIGFIGLIIMALSVMSLFKKNLTAKLLFLISFIFFELLSIFLVLHLREARYYSMVIFFSASICYIYINYRLLKKINPGIYIPVMTLLLLLLFNSFASAFFAFIVSIGLYEGLEFLKRRKINDFIVNIVPLLISLIPIICLLVFLEVFHISREYARIFNITLARRYGYIFGIVDFFRKYEFLYLVLAVKSTFVILLLCLRQSGILTLVTVKNETTKKLLVSNFLSLFFVIYILTIINVPSTVIYQRYFIVLQPILITILLLDIFIVFELIRYINFLVLRRGIATVILFLICILLALNGLNKIEHIKNHVYELLHQYRGPLDFVIPYIKSTYEHPERLVIATNYEECAYMYYLGSKVIIGYVGTYLEEDLKMRPDIIIYRKGLAYRHKPEMFNIFFQKDKYKRIFFPVFDYPVNNIPQLDGPVPHLYKTRIAKDEKWRLDVYIRQ